MPENSSPFDDPLADLYGRLPDPRRERDGQTQNEVPTSRRAARASARPKVGDQGQASPGASEPRRPQPQPTPTRAMPVAATPNVTRPPAGAAQQARTADSPGAATGTLDDLFSGRRSADEVGRVPPPSERRRRRIGGWVAFGIVIAILGGITAGGFWAWNTYGDRVREFFGAEEPQDFAEGMAHGETTITIAEGDAGPQVSQKLFDAGVIMTPTALYDHMIETSTAFTFQPGVFRLQLQMTSAAALEALGNPANRLENTAQLPEGLTVDQTVARLSEQMGVPIEEFQAAVADPAAYGVSASDLEGWLFPATYTFDPGATASDVIGRMVARTVESLDAAAVPVADRQRILTIASIIQREARFEQDFYKVSRVIQNRLDPGNQETFGKLQMDSTAQYGYGELHDGTASSTEEALNDPNPWNTYVHAGLPVGPISNPGDLAIDAALNPEPGPWLYFVTVNLDTGETEFTTTYAEHQQAIGRMNAWCRDHPDSGC